MATKKKAAKPSGVGLKEAIKNIKEKFGPDAIMMLDGKPSVAVDAISTGSIGLDYALHIGGLPVGRIVEVFGPESSGKTTLSLHVIAEAQKRGMACAFIDAEHSMDPLYAKNLGVDTSALLIAQPSNGEEALQIVDQLVRSQEAGVVVVDSVAALTPKAEIEGEIGDTHTARHARLMSHALRVLTANVSKSKTVVIFINQIRSNLAAAATWGAPLETTTGGKALKFFASVRLDIRRIETLKKGDEPIGGRVRVKVIKNKAASPFGVAEFDVLFNEGISRTAEILGLGEKYKVLTKTPGGYSYGEVKLGRGYESSRQFLAEHPDLLAEITGKILASMPV